MLYNSEPVESEGSVARVNNCFYKLKKYTKFIHADRYTLKSRALDMSKFYLRCVRGTPWNEYIIDRVEDHATVIDYLKGIESDLKDMEAYVDVQRSNCLDSDTGKFIIPGIEFGHPPTELAGKGNFFFTSVHHLEHLAEQIEYLTKRGKLPKEFVEVQAAIKHVVVPQVARASPNSLVAGVACVYRTRYDMSGCTSGVRRTNFLLQSWMVEEMKGVFNRMVYMPKARPRTVEEPFCLNPGLDYERIESRYLAGDVLQVDDLMTPACLKELRRLALEGTFFYDHKKSYVGAYLDEGMVEFEWLGVLVDEFAER